MYNNKNILRHPPVYDMNVLYDAFCKSMKGSSWKCEPQAFEWDLLSSLNKLHKSLRDKTYTTDAGTEFIMKERGKIRYIHGNTMSDRVVRHALCDVVLNPAVEKYLIHNNGASQKGKGISFSRDEFEKDLHNYYLEYGTNDGYIGIVDLSKFYDNIQHDKVRALVNPIIDEYSQWLFSNVLKNFERDMSHLSDEDFKNCMNEKFSSLEYHEQIKGIEKTGKKMMRKSVDIGDQVSQTIGIFFPTWIDNYVKIVLGEKRYGRYMDDMYVICPTKEEVHLVINGIKERANELGLFINEKKTQIHKLSDRFTYLQIKYFLDEKGKVVKRINPKTITRERRKLKKYKSLMDRGKMPYEDIKQAYKSWMGTFAPLMSKKQIKNMRKLFYDLFQEDVRWKK